MFSPLQRQILPTFVCQLKMRAPIMTRALQVHRQVHLHAQVPTRHQIQVRRQTTWPVHTPPRFSRIAGSLGAEAEGMDLAGMQGEIAIGKITKALLEHKVLIFRDQHLSPQQLWTFGRRFGDPTRYPFKDGLKDYPDIMEVSKTENEKVNFGGKSFPRTILPGKDIDVQPGVWHADTMYFLQPSRITILQAQETPPVGGDTIFANQVAAYEALSPGLQQALARLECIHQSSKSSKFRTIKTSSQDPAPKIFTSRHPAVMRHPETGKLSLYLSAGHTDRFDGWTEEESAPLLGYLYQHQVKEEFTCRVHWRAGTVVMWDNFAVQHKPVNDYHGYRRKMIRMTVQPTLKARESSAYDSEEDVWYHI